MKKIIVTALALSCSAGAYWTTTYKTKNSLNNKEEGKIASNRTNPESNKQTTQTRHIADHPPAKLQALAANLKSASLDQDLSLEKVLDDMRDTEPNELSTEELQAQIAKIRTNFSVNDTLSRLNAGSVDQRERDVIKTAFLRLNKLHGEHIHRQLLDVESKLSDYEQGLTKRQG